MNRETLGLLLGFVGVCVFAGTLPFTRLAVEALSPWFISAGRAAVAGALALVVLAALRRPWPGRGKLGALLLTSLCLVGGFPIFTALAMQSVPASHGGVVLGILPIATAAVSALVTGERPSGRFWLAALVGALLVTGFALRDGGGRFELGDLYLAAAVASSALGYVVSGRLTQGGLKGWEVISWVLVVSLPATLPLTLMLWPDDPGLVPAWSWAGFVYVSFMSQYLGFFAWNAGLAMGGIARVSQVQLLQTFVTLVFAAGLNDERVDALTWVVAVLVVAVVVIGRRAPVADGKVALAGSEKLT